MYTCNQSYGIISLKKITSILQHTLHSIAEVIIICKFGVYFHTEQQLHNTIHIMINNIMLTFSNNIILTVFTIAVSIINYQHHSYIIIITIIMINYQCYYYYIYSLIIAIIILTHLIINYDYSSNNRAIMNAQHKTTIVTLVLSTMKRKGMF